MALCRCEIHDINEDRTKHIYGAYALPIGYPETGVVCGSVGCENPARVWLNEDQIDEFKKGQRVFNVNTGTLKVRVGDKLFSKHAD
jgi:hypothetical protein